jgi:hypothetical protein
LSENTAFKEGIDDPQRWAFKNDTPDKVHPGAFERPRVLGAMQKVQLQATDTTGDGRIDTIGYDTNGDGRVDRIEHSVTGDGRIGMVEIDSTHDGKVDRIEYDTNFDGQIDTIYLDTTGDGIMDRIDRDMDHDGIIDRSELGGRITRKEGREKVIEAPLYQINEFNRA